jgi:hypothetical protein
LAFILSSVVLRRGGWQLGACGGQIVLQEQIHTLFLQRVEALSGCATRAVTKQDIRASPGFTHGPLPSDELHLFFRVLCVMYMYLGLPQQWHTL